MEGGHACGHEPEVPPAYPDDKTEQESKILSRKVKGGRGGAGDVSLQRSAFPDTRGSRFTPYYCQTSSIFKEDREGDIGEPIRRENGPGEGRRGENAHHWLLPALASPGSGQECCHWA